MQNPGYATVGSVLNTSKTTYSVWFGCQRSDIYHRGNISLPLHHISSPTNSYLVRGGLTQRETHTILEAYEIACQPFGLIASNKFKISLVIVKAEF